MSVREDCSWFPGQPFSPHILCVCMLNFMKKGFEHELEIQASAVGPFHPSNKLLRTLLWRMNDIIENCRRKRKEEEQIKEGKKGNKEKKSKAKKAGVSPQ